ncbi:replication protein [Actinobacillus porcinus]|uniref:replication protein n=1 Tax=Actinobacillus porcinus TaxID=51048 RepID=UPI002352A96C|nr:replication protein [Actinobacillus porcinus]
MSCQIIRLEDYRKAKAAKQQQEQVQRKVSKDDGFTAIPNELLFAMARFNFTQRQYAVLLAVIQKTLSWRKDMDWICNEQLAELAGLYDHKLASKVKNELIAMNVLIQQGRKVGLNLNISEWKKPDSTNHTKIVQSVRNKSYETSYSDSTNHTTTKETITKEKINNNPLPPKGESADAETGTQANVKKHRKSGNTDYQGVIDLFNRENEDTGSRLSMVLALNEKRKREIKKFLKELKEPTLECAKNYFERFFEDLRPFHWGESERGWRATFDYAIRPDTVLKVREGNL